MSALNMHPTFTDREGYQKWLATWRQIQSRHTRTIRRLRDRAKAAQREGSAEAARFQKELQMERTMGRRIMTLLDSARQRWDRLTQMKAQIAQQMAGFPLTLENCSAIDFHFNKGSLEFPLPAWVVKTKGQSYYVHHVDFSGARGTTRETPEHPSTKGSIRFRRCTLHIDREGVATITNAEGVHVAEAA